MAGESYNFEQLTKEMVVSQLKDAPDAPEQAAAVARRTIVAGLLGTQTAAAADPRSTVQQVCKGMMSGLLLAEKDLPKSAVLLLQGMAEAAQETHREPSDLMTWAMEGIAQVAPMVSPEVRAALQDAIDQAFMGAGQVFNELCQKASKRAYLDFPPA